MNMKFRKRTLAALLAVMLFCALPMGVLAVSHADHDGETFDEVYSSGDISGNKYLNEDVDLSGTDISATSTFNCFCLNGHTLSCGSLEIDNHQFFLYDCVGGGTLDCDIIVKNTTGLYIYDGISLGDVTVKGTSGYIEGVDDEAAVNSITVEANYAVLAGKLSVGEITVASGSGLTLDGFLTLSGTTTLNMDPSGTITNEGASSLLEHLTPPTGYRFKENGSTVTLEPVPSLTVKSDPTAGGTAAIDGQTDTTIYPEANDRVKLIATPNAGYEFEGWYDYDASAASLSDASTYEYSFSGTKSVTLTAKFTPVLAVENILTNTDESAVQFTATYGGGATTIAVVTALSSGAPFCSSDGVVDLTDAVPGEYEYEFSGLWGGSTTAKLFVNGVTNESALTKEFESGSTVTPNAQVKFGTPAFTYSTDGSTWVDAVDAPGKWTVKVSVTEDTDNNVPALEYTYEITVKLPKPTVSADPETVKLTSGAGSSTLTAESTVTGVTYQWKKDGAEISGATSATLTENYTAADAEKSYQYTCVVTLNGASNESDPVTVTVGKVNTIGDVQISDLTYGETPAPSLTANPTYGTAEYVYATSETGTYSATVPENAGTYYVKATVPAGADYDAVETDPVSFTINKAPNTNLPSVIVTDERVKGLKDGTIKDVTSAMEYKLSTEPETAWKTCPDGTIENLAPGTYQVRYKETDNYLAGNPTKVMVKEGGGIPSDASFRFIYTPLKTLDPALKPFFSTLADLQTDMLAKVKSQKMSNKAPTGTAYWDIVLEYCLKGDTVWHTVTGDLFPAQGFLITIPYKDIANGVTASNTKFYAAHVFTYGDKAGTYEYPDVTNATGGASLKVTGTSPLLLAYITEGGGNSGGNSGGTGSAVPTGDTNNPLLWGSLLGLSVLGCGAMVVVPKLKKKKEEKNT